MAFSTTYMDARSKCPCCSISAQILRHDNNAAAAALQHILDAERHAGDRAADQSHDGMDTALCSQLSGPAPARPNRSVGRRNPCTRGPLCDIFSLRSNRATEGSLETAVDVPAWAVCRRSCSSLTTGPLRCLSSLAATDLSEARTTRGRGRSIASVTAPRHVNGEWGRSLLHVASACGQAGMVGQLLRRGIPASVRSSLSYWGGLTPLHEAAAAPATENGLAVVWMLITSGASLLIATRTMRYTPMHWACAQGDSSVGIVALLLHHPDGLQSALQCNAIG